MRVIVVMFFHDSDRRAAGGGTGGPVVAFARRPLTLGVIAVAAVVTLALGVMPQPLLDLAGSAAAFAP